MTKEDEWKEYENMYKITSRINNLLYQCHDKNDFTLMDNIMVKCNPEKLGSGEIISLLSTMRWGESETTQYPLLFEKCKTTLMNRPDYTDDLLLGLEPK